MKATDLATVNKYIDAIRCLNKYKRVLEDKSIDNPIEIKSKSKVGNLTCGHEDITHLLDSAFVNGVADDILEHVKDLIAGYEMMLQKLGVDTSGFEPED